MFSNVININLENIYTTSLLKCEIFEKIDLNEEIKNCKNYLLKQIEILEPKLIITLGDVYKYILNDTTSLSKLRGKIFKFNNIDLIPIYHPDTLLRNPSLKIDTFTDLKKIKLLTEKL